MITFTLLEIKKQYSKRNKKKPVSFFFKLKFKITNDRKKNSWNNHYLFDELGSYRKITFLDDPIAYEKEIGKLVSENKNNWKKLLNSPLKEKWKHGYTSGLGMITKRGNEYAFSEYFSSTPVTESIVAEIKKMKRNSKYTVKTIREQYLANLLISLARFWD